MKSQNKQIGERGGGYAKSYALRHDKYVTLSTYKIYCNSYDINRILYSYDSVTRY